MTVQFHHRAEAGQLLATRLHAYADRSDVLILALPRGGVPVGFEIATALHAPLDVFLVRKLGLPGHEELAMGAIANGNIQVLNNDVVEALEIPAYVIERVAQRERQELLRRAAFYRGDRPPPEVQGRVIILVDDGIATGSTMRAAIAALHVQQPARLVVAVPTAPPDTVALLQAEVDEVVCLITPQPFYAVGYWYRDFAQISDAEVRELLAWANRKYQSVSGSIPVTTE